MRGLKNVLIVEVNPASRRDLGEELRLAGSFAVTEATTTTEAIALASRPDAPFDAILLDTSPNDQDAGAVCHRMRRIGVRIPILVLTHSLGEATVVSVLDSGANDCVARPLRIAELAARVRAHIRAHESSEDTILPIGPYEFRPEQKLLRDTTTNRRIRLTMKEAAVLNYLYRAGDSPVARKTLLHEVWGYSAGADTHTVETHIYRLRRKIEPDPRRIRLLINVDGGYRLSTDPLLPAPRIQALGMGMDRQMAAA